MAIDIEAARQYYQQREAERRAQREDQRQAWLQRVRGAVSRVAVTCAGVQRVYIFGSLVRPGRFRADSDIDIAVECDTVQTESAFWHALEQELQRDVDVRPLAGVIGDVALTEGEQVYGRKSPDSGQ